MRWTKIATGLIFAFGGGAVASTSSTEWAWLFPIVPPLPTVTPNGEGSVRVAGSKATYTEAQTRDLKHAIDWFPREHPAMPPIVSAGHDNANACGFCHLPDGNGRPENSALAGLSPDYIKEQVAAFADGSRQAAMPSSLTTRTMAATARAVSSAEVAAAASYFSGLTYRSHVRVVETAELAFRPGRFVYMLRPGAREPIDGRIVEVPLDPDDFERRDPHVRFVAFVPPGSVSAGKALAESGGTAQQPCAICHGEGLRGGIAPPLAGRSPTMLARQLAAFKTGTRANDQAAPMRSVAAGLSGHDIVAVTSYAGTLRP